MSDRPPTALVHSRAERRRRLLLIWAIPIVTAALGAWLIWKTFSDRGPQITISFQSAEGLVAGQSRVRHKDVEMGVIEQIDLSPDLKRVILTVRMNRASAPLLTDKARFWIVKPRVFAGSVTGLQTIISGSYVEFRPSTEAGEPQRSFVGLEDPPVIQADTAGREFRLKADRIGSINLGSPIFFRDLSVGEVLGWDVSEMAESVTIHAFVRAPFDKYVHDSTRFWNASGLSVDVGVNGLQVQVESLRALVLGGIAFDTPSESVGAPPSPALHQFTLYPSKERADGAIYQRSPPVLAVFTGTVAGLTKGAPVKLRGIKIGEVTKVTLEYDRLSDSVVAIAQFFVEPDRIGQLQFPSDAKLEPMLQGLVRRGLRVKMETASFITGYKQLSIDLYPLAEPATLGHRDGMFVVPVIENGGGDLVASASAVMERINAIPFEEIGRNLNEMLSSANTVASDPNLVQTIAALKATLGAAQSFVQNLNRGVEPLTQKLPSIASHLDEAIRRADRLVGSVEQGYGANSQVNRDVSRVLVQLGEAARSIRVLADLLSRHPEALIRGRASQGPQ